MLRGPARSAPLVLKDVQGGFAGETGLVWTITPDDSYTVARQIGLKVLEANKKGRLTPEQRARLEELLDWMTAAPSSGQLGGMPQVNSRRITLYYGSMQSAVSVPPGGRDLASADAQTRRMLELANDLKAHIGS